MAREDRGVEDEAAKSGGWRADGSRLVGGWLGWVGEADCTRCAVRLTACALRRRPTTLLFEKGREDGGTEGRRGDGWNGRARGGGGEGGKGRWRVWVAAVAAIPEAPASASAARHESTEDETREKERLREGQEKRDTEKEKRREGQEERRRERKTERPQNE